MRARLLIFAALVGAAAAMATTTAADDRPGGSGGAYVDPSGDPTAVATDGGSGDGGGGPNGGGSVEPCLAGGGRGRFRSRCMTRSPASPRRSATGRWLGRWCDGDGGLFGYFLRPEGGLVDPHQLALDTLASVSIAQSYTTSPSQNGSLSSRYRPGCGSTRVGGSPTRPRRTPAGCRPRCGPLLWPRVGAWVRATAFLAVGPAPRGGPVCPRTVPPAPTRTAPRRPPAGRHVPHRGHGDHRGVVDDERPRRWRDAPRDHPHVDCRGRGR